MLEEIPTRFLKLNIKNGRNFLPTMTSYNPDTFIFRISQEGNIISGTTYDSSQVRNKLEILDSDNMDNIPECIFLHCRKVHSGMFFST